MVEEILAGFLAEGLVVRAGERFEATPRGLELSRALALTTPDGSGRTYSRAGAA